MPATPSAAPPAPEGSLSLYSHRGTRAVQRLVEFAPSTGGLALWVHHRDLPVDVPARDDAAPLACTDGLTVFYAATFEALPLAEQAGWVAHELLHIALRHAQRQRDLQQRVGDVDPVLFNACADAVVNTALDHLGWLQLPRHALRLEQLLASALRLQATPEAALLQWDVESLYRAVDDRRDARTGLRAWGQASSRGGEGAAPHSDGASPQRPDGPVSAAVRALASRGVPDLLPAALQGNAPEDEAEQARQWCERLQRAHAGDGAHSLLRALLADLPRAHTPWEQLLRSLLARALAPRSALSWSRPSRSYIANQGRSGAHRRLPFEPGFSPSRRVPRLVVVVDVSGSIDPPLLERFARELQALLRRLEAGLVLVLGDDRVREVRQVREGAPGCGGLDEIRFQGGGGTDFTPLLQEAEGHRPDAVLVLTDLDGPARHRPRCPVIWVVTEAHADAEAPFGRKLVLR